MTLHPHSMSGDPFCPHCDVSNDLHDGPDTCASAEAKAAVLERFGMWP